MLKPVYIACDDSGYDMKLEVLSYFKKHCIEYVDLGSDENPSRYPWFAAGVASAVSCGKAERGILICGSGIGMCIAANKFPGVRAANVSDSYEARLTRRHNDSNIVCLGGKTNGVWSVLNIVDVWLNTDYDGGHHEGSLALISEMEKTMMTGKIWCPEGQPYPDFKWNSNQDL